MLLAQLHEIIRRRAQRVIDERPKMRKFIIIGSLEIAADIVELSDQIDQDAVFEDRVHDFFSAPDFAKVTEPSSGPGSPTSTAPAPAVDARCTRHADGDAEQSCGILICPA
jgi:hypothetical protein